MYSGMLSLPLLLLVGAAAQKGTLVHERYRPGYTTTLVQPWPKITQGPTTENTQHMVTTKAAKTTSQIHASLMNKLMTLPWSITAEQGWPIVGQNPTMGSAQGWQTTRPRPATQAVSDWVTTTRPTVPDQGIKNPPTFVSQWWLKTTPVSTQNWQTTNKYAPDDSQRRKTAGQEPVPEDTLKKQLPLQSAIERGLIQLCLGLQRASATNTLKGENVVFAPLSIAAVHALLLEAASGITKKELEKLFGVDKIPYNEDVLHQVLSEFIFNVESSKQVEQNLMSASGLFPQAGSRVDERYKEFARSKYYSEILPLDYKSNPMGSTEYINSWVSKRTKGKINKVLDEIVDSSTSLIIANAFYFKGSWEQPFNVNYTKKQKFFVSKKESVEVPMMISILEVPYGARRGSHSILGLPYKGGELVMYFVLPDSDLRQFVDQLTLESIRDLVNQTSRQNVIVAIPRMKVEGSLELSKSLHSLGLHSLFDPRTSQLPSLGNGSYVSEVVHKVAVEVTEWGTEAAAATSTIIHRDGSMPLFRADRPFLFFIYHHGTNAILFWGTVFRPVE